ncbi:DNA-binding transcriptional regulator, MerR family [Agromyces sp. CF514]|uniref:MerR family transcriptional regulator n=1 Tax=Agromyces sp. CF514 TaxID=1881031 RepID=UPI0008E1833C|nr:MerR family transcriptional regulator [Agromyces sp. CF514]SFR71077.1 DNA-binding transcriptional regulator, MerR family [Agromyces sp. CF514]
MAEFTPAQVVERTGFSLDTLRYYEREGLIGPIDRTAGGRRTYRQEHLDWLGLVRCLRDTGMPIADLKRYTALADDESTLAQRIELLERHDREVQASIDLLLEQQRHLHEKIAWYRGQAAAAQVSLQPASAVGW